MISVTVLTQNGGSKALPAPICWPFITPANIETPVRIPMVPMRAISASLSSALFYANCVLYVSEGVTLVANSSDKRSSDSKLLTVLIIEQSREMQRLLRAMLSGYGIRDVRAFSNSERAANAILTDPPSMVLLNWDSVPFDGASFLKLIRHQNMYPVCLVPIIVMFSEARKRQVESALKLGAHAVVAKPVAPAMLFARMHWILAGHQQLRLEGGRYVVDGIQERLAIEHDRLLQMESAREYQASQFAEMTTIQSDVDRILQVNF